MNKFAVLDDSDDEERVAKPVAVKEKPVKVKKTAAPAEVAAPAAPPSATNAGNGKSKEKEQNGEKSKSKAPDTVPENTRSNLKTKPQEKTTAAPVGDAEEGDPSKENVREAAEEVDLRKSKEKQAPKKPLADPGENSTERVALDGTISTFLQFIFNLLLQGRGEQHRGGRGPYGFGNVKQDALEAEKDPATAEPEIEAVDEAAAAVTDGEVAVPEPEGWGDGAEAAAEPAAPVPEPEPEPATFLLDDYLERLKESRARVLAKVEVKPELKVDMNAPAYAGLTVKAKDDLSSDAGKTKKDGKEKTKQEQQLLDATALTALTEEAAEEAVAATDRPRGAEEVEGAGPTPSSSLRRTSRSSADTDHLLDRLIFILQLRLSAYLWIFFDKYKKLQPRSLSHLSFGNFGFDLVSISISGIWVLALHYERPTTNWVMLLVQSSILCWAPTIIDYMLEICGVHSPSLEIVARASLYSSGFLNFLVFGMQDPHLQRSLVLIYYRLKKAFSLWSASTPVAQDESMTPTRYSSENLLKTERFLKRVGGVGERCVMFSSADEAGGRSRGKKHIYRFGKLSAEEKALLYVDRPDLDKSKMNDTSELCAAEATQPAPPLWSEEAVQGSNPDLDDAAEEVEGDDSSSDDEDPDDEDLTLLNEPLL
eukprot:gene18748-19052_t